MRVQRTKGERGPRFERGGGDLSQPSVNFSKFLVPDKFDIFLTSINRYALYAFKRFLCLFLWVDRKAKKIEFRALAHKITGET